MMKWSAFSLLFIGLFFDGVNGKYLVVICMMLLWFCNKKASRLVLFQSKIEVILVTRLKGGYALRKNTQGEPNHVK